MMSGQKEKSQGEEMAACAAAIFLWRVVASWISSRLGPVAVWSQIEQ